MYLSLLSLLNLKFLHLFLTDVVLMCSVVSHSTGELCIDKPNGYYYLKQSGCISDPTIDDKQDFANVLVSHLSFLSVLLSILRM